MKRGKKILKGINASAGEAEGKVKILADPEETEKMEENDILVAPITDPQYTPAILKASAIVTDVGGTLSHPSIVSRELGIPCVVNTKKATEKLKNGEKVIVNGTEGVVYATK